MKTLTRLILTASFVTCLFLAGGHLVTTILLLSFMIPAWMVTVADDAISAYRERTAQIAHKNSVAKETLKAQIAKALESAARLAKYGTDDRP